MAISGTVQALIAAFFFGIVFNTASAGFALYVKGHGTALSRDGLRLALILFLASSALWALVDFLATLIDPTATSTCQVAVIISSLLDQFARVSIEQFLIWAVARDGLKSPAGLATQVLLLARFVVGMVFVGVTKPQFNSTCVPFSNVVPVAIAVIVLDAIILTSTAVLALTASSTKSGQGSKTILLIIAALAVWMGTSVTLLLGLSTLDAFFRTTLPAIGLFILSALVTIMSGNLAMSGERRPRLPESPTPQNMNRDLDLSTADSDDYPPTRYEVIKGMNGLTVQQFSPPELPPPPAEGNNSALPTLARPITGVVGIGGLPIQGQLFPPMRAKTADQVLTSDEIKTRIDLPKRSQTAPSGKAVKVGKAPKGKLAISAPIPINDPEAQNAFSKIPTVDLATAAKNEQERREGYARRVSALIANRPAPKPPTAMTDEEVKRSMSLRKEVGQDSSVDIERSNSMKTSQSGGLSVEGNASSTSAQLSPGNEALRRRSPRQAAPTMLPAKTPTKTPTFQPITPGKPFRIPIPRAQPPPEPESVPPPMPEPVKTPLQRRPTNGLPSNPRAQAVKIGEKVGNDQPQTVMFINEIEYNDPSYVNDIIQGATKTPYTPLHSSNSVVHRPRPIPRKIDRDRQVFPSERASTHGHRRTKSGGSIASRRSVLQSQPGSPTQLPPLPPPPQSAGVISRPQPNNTKSMTFDEKMSMFYTGPPSASPTASNTAFKRKSSVPDLPPLPPTYLPTKNSPIGEQYSQAEGDRRLTRTTATDQTSIRTQSILGVEDLGGRYVQEGDQNVADSVGNSWLPGIPTNDDATNRNQYEGNKRQSSPVIPGLRFSTVSGKTQDDATTNWGSEHSPVAAINLSANRLNANSTWIKKDSRMESVLSGFGDEVMTVMLDTSSEHSNNNRQSFLLDEEESVRDVANSEKHGSGQWHHRVGDDCPTFSTRKEKVKSRKMPPPTPLLLRGVGKQNAVIIQTAEPSPLESPEAAYNMIQAQLRKLEEPNRDSVTSEGRRMALLEDLEAEMGQQENRWQTMQYNLDRNSTSTIQTDSRPLSVVTPVARTSITGSVLAERRASRRAQMLSDARAREEMLNGTTTSVQDAQDLRASIFQTRLAAAQMEYMDNAPDSIMNRNNVNFFSVSKADLGSPTPPDTDESEEMGTRFESLDARLSPMVMKEVHHLWQLSEPKLEPVNQLLWKAPIQEPVSVNILELPGLSVRPVARKGAESLTIESTQLWNKAPQSTKSGADMGLWGNTVLQKLPELPAQKPQAPQEPPKARPVTQRPPRRSKRVTLLPDIIENPEPLPDKRGTLGIFQFPWGERSENATVRPRPTQPFAAIPGTMSSGGPRVNAAMEARAKQLEAEEYSSSFFDDYDEESDEGDNFDEEFEDSGDEFDENTLWEIASLLKTDVPSKNSLLPPELSSSVIDDYMGEEPSDEEYDDEEEEEEEEEYKAVLSMASEEPTPSATPLFLMSQDEVIRTSLWESDAKALLSRQSFGLAQPEEDVWQSYIPSEADVARPRAQIDEELPIIESKQLWMPMSGQSGMTPSLWIPNSKSSDSEQSFGLPQPVLDVWEMYLPAPAAPVRSQPRIEEPCEIASTSLWEAEAVKVENPNSPLWAAPKSSPPAPKSIPAAPLPTPVPASVPSQENRRSFMWEKPATLTESQATGLFSAKLARLDFRRTSEAPIAASMKVKPHARKEPLQALTTEMLWRSAPKLVARTSGKRQTMWSPTSVRVANTTTLFQIDPKRKHYRNTSAEPAAISMTTKPRKSDAPLPELSSSQTWSSNGAAKAEINWIKASSSSSPAAPARSVASVGGLFTVDSQRKQWRTTSAEPAALDMTTVSRTVRAPLAGLESTRLWGRSRTVTADFDWITISSVRPRSPSIASVASSSAPSSPVTDASSIRTTSTKASTVAPSISSLSSARGIFERKKKPESDIPDIPEDAEMPRISESIDEPFTTLSEVPRKKRAQAPAPELHRPAVVSADEWDAALQEAIKASHISPKIERRTASPKEWSAALNLAIAASFPQGRLSRGQVLPSEWDEELREAIARSQRTMFDVSKRHPVFFGSMATTTADVHPAMFGMTSPAAPAQTPSASQPLLWSSSASAAARNPEVMWAPAAPVITMEAPVLPQLESALTRKPSKRVAAEMPESFDGEELWMRRDSRDEVHDWLRGAMI